MAGVWAALQGTMHAEPNEITDVISSKSQLIATKDLRNPAILFDVVDHEGTPIVKLNSSHQAFSNGQALELILQAWAEMESTAWDRRKQVLEDIRSDWGRVARDLIQPVSEVESE